MAEVEDLVSASEVSEVDDDVTDEDTEPGNKRKTLELRHDPEAEVKYNTKFKSPMKKKRKNDYDPEEEARLLFIR